MRGAATTVRLPLKAQERGLSCRLPFGFPPALVSRPASLGPDAADPWPQSQALPPICGGQLPPFVSPPKAQECGLSCRPPFWVPPAPVPRPANLGPKSPSSPQGELRHHYSEVTGTKRVLRWGWMACQLEADDGEVQSTTEVRPPS
ncbi:hypothetical protein NDU88_001702 [Pleurodeles waltl]|uniref:Uncharacterized protein n=1 Tax=Pleurodeles waltl TaxID=8319 RepID=A0AAV7NBI4_PLEWA|nr:hypothetical protein NDU88_001702 [Pleurodeles waltl]